MIALADGQDDALGIATSLEAGAFWGVSWSEQDLCKPAMSSDEVKSLFGSLWVANVSITAARLALLHQNVRRVRQIVAHVSANVEYIAFLMPACFSSPDSRFDYALKPAAALSTLRQRSPAAERRVPEHALGDLIESMASEIEALQSLLPDDDAELEPADAVAIIARIDSCYYALFNHYVTCGWPAPPVPPPHLFFPATVNACGPCTASFDRFVERYGLPRSVALLRDVAEGTSESLSVTMWARFREGTHLLWGSGLGTNGEAMEEAAMASVSIPALRPCSVDDIVVIDASCLLSCHGTQCSACYQHSPSRYLPRSLTAATPSLIQHGITAATPIHAHCGPHASPNRSLRPSPTRLVDSRTRLLAHHTRILAPHTRISSPSTQATAELGAEGMLAWIQRAEQEDRQGVSCGDDLGPPCSDDEAERTRARAGSCGEKEEEEEEEEDEGTLSEGEQAPVLDTLAGYAELDEFRSSARGWPSHLYAFAPPTGAALDAIARWAEVRTLDAIARWAEVRRGMPYRRASLTFSGL